MLDINDAAGVTFGYSVTTPGCGWKSYSVTELDEGGRIDWPSDSNVNYLSGPPSTCTQTASSDCLMVKIKTDKDRIMKFNWVIEFQHIGTTLTWEQWVTVTDCGGGETVTWGLVSLPDIVLGRSLVAGTFDTSILLKDGYSQAATDDEANCPLYSFALYDNLNLLPSTDSRLEIVDSADFATTGHFKIDVTSTYELVLVLRPLSISQVTDLNTVLRMKVRICGTEKLFLKDTYKDKLKVILPYQQGHKIMTYNEVYAWFEKYPVSNFCNINYMGLVSSYVPFQNDVTQAWTFTSYAQHLWVDEKIDTTNQIYSNVNSGKYFVFLSNLVYHDTVYIQVRSDGQVPAYREVESAVCKTDSITQTASNTQISFFQHRGDNSTEGYENQIVYSNALFKNMLTMSNCAMCGTVQYFRVIKSDNTTLTGTQIYINATNQDLMINTTNGFSYQNLKIEGYVNTTVEDSQCSFINANTIDLVVEICGKEIVTTTGEEYSFTHTIGREQNYELSNLTTGFGISQPSNCFLSRYELWDKHYRSLNSSGPTIWSQFIIIDHITGNVKVNLNNNPGIANETEYSIYFVAISSGNRTNYKTLKFKFLLPPTNSPPEFVSYPSDITLRVSGDDQIRGYLEPLAIFLLPNATDEEGNEISRRISFNTTFPCQCIREVYRNGDYFIEVDKRRIGIEEQGTWQTAIELVDDVYTQFFKKSIYLIHFTIIYNAAAITKEKVQGIVSQSTNSKEAIEQQVKYGGVVFVDSEIDQSRLFSISNQTEVDDIIYNHLEQVSKIRFEPITEETIPVVLNIDKITMDGFIHISFNQPLIKPPFSEFLIPKLNFKTKVEYNITGDDPDAWGLYNFMGFGSAQEDRLIVHKSYDPNASIIQQQESKEIAQAASLADKLKQVQLALAEEKAKLFQQQDALAAYQEERINREAEIAAALQAAKIAEQQTSNEIQLDLSSKSGKRQLRSHRDLLSLSQLNVTRDIMDFKYNIRSDLLPESIKYDITIREWTKLGMILHVNFNETTLVSTGDLFDQAYLVIKNKNLFIAEKNGMILQNEQSTLLDFFPRQVLKGVDAEMLELQAIIMGKAFMALIIIQGLYIWCSIGKLHDFWRLFFALQIVCYMEIYDVIFPANASIYLAQLRQIIEFDFINVESIVQLFEPSWTVKKELFGISEQFLVQHSDQNKSIFDGYLFYIFVIGMLILSYLFLSISRRFCKSWTNKKLAYIGEGMRYNWVIRCLTISYLLSCVIVGDQVTMMIQGSPYQDISEIIVAWILLGLIIAIPLFSTCVLQSARKYLDQPKIYKQISNLYRGIHLYKSPRNLQFFPVFLLRRFIFVAIPTLIYEFPWLQIQMLLFLSTLYIIWYGSLLPHEDKSVTRLEIFNEMNILVIIYHFILFSDFNLNDWAVFYYGYSLILFTGVLIMVNVIYMINKEIVRNGMIRSLKVKQTDWKQFLIERKGRQFISHIRQQQEIFEKKLKFEDELKLERDFFKSTILADEDYQKPIKQSLPKLRQYMKKLKLKPNMLETIIEEDREIACEEINNAIFNELGNFGQIVDISRQQILEGYVRPKNKEIIPRFVSKVATEEQDFDPETPDVEPLPPRITFDNSFKESSKQRWTSLFNKHKEIAEISQIEFEVRKKRDGMFDQNKFPEDYESPGMIKNKQLQKAIKIANGKNPDAEEEEGPPDLEEPSSATKLIQSRHTTEESNVPEKEAKKLTSEYVKAKMERKMQVNLRTMLTQYQHDLDKIATDPNKRLTEGQKSIFE